MENKWYQSSTGSGELSLTIKGLLTALIPVAMYFAKQQSWDITEAQIWDFINAVLAVVSTVTILVGLARKIFLSLKK